jgi:hypothetical protein
VNIGVLLAVLTVIGLTATAPQIGLTWDDPAYIVASESYVAWLKKLVTQPGEALSARQIQQFWTPNHEHQPLDKVWSGLVWAGARYVFDDLPAHRLGNILLVSIMVGMLYSWMAKAYSQVAGLVAAAVLMAMPR